MRYRFGSKRRDGLYARERVNAYLEGLGPHPRCNLCGEPVLPDQAWHESHAGAPKCFGGKRVGVAHAECNLEHGRTVVTPAWAKSSRVRRFHAGTRRAKHPMPCGRASGKTKTFNKGVLTRMSGAEKHALTMAMREVRGS
jgi:hypothetical protein